MNFLSKVTTGKIKKPYNVLLYGIDGIGKSSWAAKAPKPLFIGTEDGTNNLDVARFNGLRCFSDIMGALSELMAKDHGYKTIVLDTADWVEKMMWVEIVGASGKNINTWNGGYGAGREETKKRFMELTRGLSNLREHKGMNVIILAHSEIESFADPTLNETYNRHQLKMDKRVSSLLRENADDVLFATYKVYAKKEGSEPTKTYGDGVRVVYTERRPAFDASNRSGLPFEMALSFPEYESAVTIGEPESEEAVVQRLDGLLSTVTDIEFRDTVMKTIAKFKGNVPMLEQVANRLQVRLTA